VGQFEAWTGKAAPVEEMTRAAVAAVAGVQARAVLARDEGAS
jgi:hypothetical protein